VSVFVDGGHLAGGIVCQGCAVLCFVWQNVLSSQMSCWCPQVHVCHQPHRTVLGSVCSHYRYMCMAAIGGCADFSGMRTHCLSVWDLLHRHGFRV
jgi:hypothetical protein